MKLLICDLDGTIRRTKSGAKFINNPEDQEIIPLAFKALEKYAEIGWTIVGCSNQGGVEFGFKSLENCIREQQITLELCPYINQIFIAPSNNQCISIYQDYGYQYNEWKIDNGYAVAVNNFEEKWICEGFRKPNTGMIEAIKLVYDDFDEILFVGDMDSDFNCAQNAKIPFVWAKNWYEQ